MLMTAAVIFMVLIDSGAKALVDTYPVQQIIFFRSAFALIPVGVLVWRGGGWKGVRIRHPWAHLLRAVCGLLAMLTFFTALRTMTLADTTAVAMAAPLFITALAIPVLGERVGVHRWGALVVGMIGVQKTGDSAAEIRRLRVLETSRRRGVGTLLMEKALGFCQRHGYLKIILDVRIERSPAIGLFGKFGFQLARTRDIDGQKLLDFYLDLYREPDA